MLLPEHSFILKQSTLSGAGSGLFTLNYIAKGTCLLEYKGTITSWKNVNHNDGKNAYVFYVNRNHVVDAQDHPLELARYINDANGLQKIKGVTNNTYYVIKKKRVFVYALKNIKAGSEIFVDYGKGYWDTIREYLQNAKEENKK